MGFFSFKHEPKEQIDLLFDIGSISIGVALVKRTAGKNPEIIYTDREYIPFQTELNTKRFADSIIKALGQASERVFQEGLEHLYFTKFGHRKIKSVYCNFFSPWYVSKTKIVKIKKEQPFSFGKDFIDKLIAEEEKLFIDKVVAGGHFNNTGPHLEVIENTTLTVKLNGYETAEPFNKKASEAEIAMFMSLAPREILNRIRETLSHHWSAKHIFFHTFAAGAFSAVRNIFPGQNDFLVVDIGGEVSDILLAKDGVLLESISFPVGKNFFIRTLAKVLEVEPNVAKSSLKLFNEGQAETSVSTKIESALKDIQKNWLSEFHKAIKTFSKSTSMPERIFLTSNDDISSLVCRVMQGEKFLQFGIVEAEFDVVALTTKRLHDFVGLGKKATPDAFLALQAAYVDHAFPVK